MSPFLVAAYIVFWAFPMLLLYSIWARQRQAERQIAALEEEIRERRPPTA